MTVVRIHGIGDDNDDDNDRSSSWSAVAGTVLAPPLWGSLQT